MKHFVFIALIAFHCGVQAINVTFINPSIPGTPFWDRVTAIAKAAANDFNINLTVVYGKDNRIFNLEAIQSVASNPVKPDYLIFMPYDGNSDVSFATLESAKIPFITIERTLLPEEQAFISLPQVKFSYWLGEIFHDNVVAGERLADALISAARKEYPENQPLNIVGISGSFSGESNQRTLGLEKSIDKHKNVYLKQVVPGVWSRERSRSIIYQLAGRFGHIDIAWTASDGMALGVLDSVMSGNTSINKHMKIGGIDWTSEAISKIKSKELTATVGGHIFQTAWALTKIYDHHHGLDVFKKGADIKTYDLNVIDSNNIENYYIYANKLNWNVVDFTQFSLIENKQSDYNFDLTLVTKLLNAE